MNVANATPKSIQKTFLYRNVNILKFKKVFLLIFNDSKCLRSCMAVCVLQLGIAVASGYRNSGISVGNKAKFITASTAIQASAGIPHTSQSLKTVICA